MGGSWHSDDSDNIDDVLFEVRKDYKRPSFIKRVHNTFGTFIMVLTGTWLCLIYLLFFT